MFAKLLWDHYGQLLLQVRPTWYGNKRSPWLPETISGRAEKNGFIRHSSLVIRKSFVEEVSDS
jgi:hypothetical protein